MRKENFIFFVLAKKLDFCGRKREKETDEFQFCFRFSVLFLTILGDHHQLTHSFRKERERKRKRKNKKQKTNKKSKKITVSENIFWVNFYI